MIIKFIAGTFIIQSAKQRPIKQGVKCFILIKIFGRESENDKVKALVISQPGYIKLGWFANRNYQVGFVAKLLLEKLLKPHPHHWMPLNNQHRKWHIPLRQS